MRNGISGKKSFVKAICLFLTLVMVFSMFIFDIEGLKEVPDAFASYLQTASVTPIPGSKVSDADTSNFTFSNAPPGYTGTDITFLNDTRNDGRVWTDKSVNATQAFIYDTSGGVVNSVQAAANEFLVTLSALSQSTSIENIIVEPSDTVFIIDVSGSMVNNPVPGDGRTRVAVVIEALNDVIKMLMNADPNNRISVVVYGGSFIGGQNHARALKVLDLGRYDASTPIFTVSGSTVTVRSNVTTLQRTFTVDGGTPTQWGIARGAQVLLDVAKGTPDGTQIVVGPPSNPITVTRKPNIILMTDGEPTFAWHDYTMSTYQNRDGTDFSYNVGNGSNADMGLTALTVMTASHFKQQVRDHYYGTADTSSAVGFYTLGLGVNSTVSNAMLDPYGKSAGGALNASLVNQAVGSTNYNMLDILNNFALSTAPVPVPYLNKGAVGTSVRPIVNITNSGGYVKSCNYDTLSFTALDKAGLDDAFNQITQQIVSQGNYSTNTGDGTAQYDGYLAFSDVVGEYMKFARFEGLWYNNVQYDARSFASAINGSSPGSATWNAFIRNSFGNHLNKPGGVAITDAEFEALIQANASNLNAGGNSRIVYYADNNRDYINSVGTGGTLISRSDAITAGAKVMVELYTVQGNAKDALDGTTDVNLNLIVFQVVTILEDGSFPSYLSPVTGNDLVSVLKEGDQIIRWYIPASLLPLRGVDRTGGSIQVKDAVPLRVIYSIIPDMDAINDNMTTLYMDVNKGTRQNSYFFYANRWRGMDGMVQSNGARAAGTLTRNDSANMALSYFEPSTTNAFYNRTASILTEMKGPNPSGPTGTSPWCWRFNRFSGANNLPVQVQSLGNNGRMEMEVARELTDIPITIKKTFNTTGAPGLTLPGDYNSGKISSISFTITGFGPAPYPTIGPEIFRKTIFLDDFDYNPVTREYTYPEEIYVPPGTYTFYESGGLAIGYIAFKPPPMVVMLPGPVTEFKFDNVYTGSGPSPATSGLWLKKVFHGLSNDQIPDFELELWYQDVGGARLINTYPKAVFMASGLPPFTINIKADSSGNPLQPGKYWVVEKNVDVPGYNMETVPDPAEFTVPAGGFNTGYAFVLDNIYNPIVPPRPPPVATYSLTLRKDTVPSPLVITTVDDHGVPVTIIQEPSDLAFKIEGTAGTPTGGYLKTIRWNDLDSNRSARVDHLLAGRYTITEYGGEVGGYTGPRKPIPITVNGVSATLDANNSYAFTLGPAAPSIAFVFTNIYSTGTPPPPPPPPTGTPPPAPQTGDTRSMMLPLILLSAAVLCISGAEIFRRAYIRNKK